jgi:DNA-directed RNA polymerase subunit H (RpoH/RPB5)
MSNYRQEVLRSFATIGEMLVDRGEDTASLQHVSGEDVLALGASRNVFFVDLPSCGYRVIYNLQSKFKLGDIRKVLDVSSSSAAAAAAVSAPPSASSSSSAAAASTAAAPANAGSDPPLRTFLIVTREKPAASAKKGIAELGLDVQFFDVRELQYNVSRHSLVPLHEPVRDEARIAEVMQRYHLKSRYHLPLILSSEPMARYLALKPGQLVRITRVCPSAGHYTLYRCCQRG